MQLHSRTGVRSSFVSLTTKMLSDSFTERHITWCFQVTAEFTLLCALYVFAQNILTTVRENIQTEENWPQTHSAKLAEYLVLFFLVFPIWELWLKVGGKKKRERDYKFPHLMKWNTVLPCWNRFKRSWISFPKHCRSFGNSLLYEKGLLYPTPLQNTKMLVH